MTELEKYKMLNKELELENKALKENMNKDLKKLLDDNNKVRAELEYIKTGRLYRLLKKMKSIVKRG